MMLEMEIVFQPIHHRFLNKKENIFEQFSSRVKRSTIKEFRDQVQDSLRLVRDSQSRNPKQYFSESRTCGLVNV